MSEIKNYQDLLKLKEQLESDLLIQREVIRVDVLELKRELKPVAALLSGLGRIPTKIITHPLLSMGIGILGEVLVKNTLLGRTGWVAKLALPFLAKRYTPQFLNNPFVRKLIDKVIPHQSNGRGVM